MEEINETLELSKSCNEAVNQVIELANRINKAIEYIEFLRQYPIVNVKQLKNIENILKNIKEDE